MFLRKGAKRSTSSSKTAFENAFFERLGQTPVEFVYTKLHVGSDKRSVEYLYEITAAEIARRNHCKAIPFDDVYPEAERMPRMPIAKREVEKVQKRGKQRLQEYIEICQREFLNRKGCEPFGGQCAAQLDSLYRNKAFRDRISQISTEYAQIEFCSDTKDPEYLQFKRETIPRRMRELGLTEYPAVQTICDFVVRDGKSQKSALITIYYSVRKNMLMQQIMEGEQQHGI